MIRLEVMNRICPRCGNPNWMRRIVGNKSDGVGRLNVKCLNCMSYFNEDELIETAKQEKCIFTNHTSLSNGDKIRMMSDEELAELFS